MSDKLSIEPGKTAVLIMDYQTDIIGFLGTNQQDFLKRASQVLQASRDAKIVVITSSNVGSGRCETDR